MAQGREIPFAEAAPVAQSIVDALVRVGPDIEVQVAGSIRRYLGLSPDSRPPVHDIDVVVICPTAKRVRLAQAILSLQDQDKPWATPEKIWKFVVKNVPVDIYFATPETWTTLLIVRTGSAKHNVMVAQKAKSLGMKWHADGAGLEKAGAFLKTLTEHEVFHALGMPYAPPAEREVK